MRTQAPHVECQVACLQHVAQGRAQVPPESVARRLKLMVRRRLDPARERTIKSRLNTLLNRLAQHTGGKVRPSRAGPAASTVALQTGDLVRVRSRQEIEATLNHWRQVQGCTFMPEMMQYCGTTQRVLKPMERFVDERDLRAKRCKGIVLLEGVLCQGTAEFGRCDRACHLFWRQEWLEKI